MGRKRRSSPALAGLALTGLLCLPGSATLAGDAAATSGSSALFGPRAGTMTVYETPDFTLVTIGNPQLRRDIAKLPQFRRAMERVLNVTAKPTGIPTYMYVVSSSVWNRYLEPSRQIPSEFVPTRFANYIIASGALIHRGGLFHEHAHLFLHTQMPGAYPLWFDEGFAVMMSRGEFIGDKVRLHPANGDVGGWIEPARLLRITKSSPEYLGGAQSTSFHFQSLVMVHRALFENPEFGTSVRNYLGALNNLQSIDEAARANFPMGLDRLDGELRAYIGRSWKHYASLEIGTVAEAPLPAGRELPPEETLWRIATVALDTGSKLDRVGELLDAAEKRAPKNPRTQLLRMRLAARQEDDGALEQLYLAIMPQLADAELARAAGLALFERTQYLQARPANATLKQQLFARSYDLLDRSLDAHPDDPEAVWAFATVAAGLNRGLEAALRRLEPMFTRLPRNPEMASAAALVHEARGSHEDMLGALTATFRFSHSYDQRRWAAEKIAEVKEELAVAKAP